MSAPTEHARLFRTAAALPGMIDSLLTWAELTPDQREQLTEAANLSDRLCRALGCMEINRVKIHQIGNTYQVAGGGVQVAGELGLDGALEVVRRLTGRIRGAVALNAHDGPVMVDIRPKSVTA